MQKSRTPKRTRTVRLHVEQPLAAGGTVSLAPAQAHYLGTVMRLGPGAEVLVFNGRDGEWSAEVAEIGRKAGALVVAAQTRPQDAAPDCWLLFAPVKSARTDFIVEKATELGASRILPVLTRFTQTSRFNGERQRAHAIEAAEQSGRLDVPEVGAPQALADVLGGWPGERALFFCDEAGDAPLLADAAGELSGPACAILVGPEGGFDEAERALLRAQPFVRPVTLGPRILRAETAALAALANVVPALERRG